MYFTLSELTHSATAVKRGLRNTPDARAKANLDALVANVLDPLRRLYGHPIRVNSGYRSPAVNAAVGGVAGSQHCLGEAADITAGTPSENRRLLGLLLAHAAEIPFDQLIAERCDSNGNPRWLHVSYRTNNRGQFLVCR